ncbi:MAG: Na+/H+ antiporter NhaC family protein [bacterium]
MRYENRAVSAFVFVVLCLLIWQPAQVNAQSESTIPADSNATITRLELQLPNLVLKNVAFSFQIKSFDQDGNLNSKFSGPVHIQGINIRTETGELTSPQTILLHNGEAAVSNALLQSTGRQTIQITHGRISAESRVRVIPGPLSLLPPLLAIALAFLARQVLLSLFCGIWLGSIFLFDYNPILGFMKTIDTYLTNSLADSDHAAILIFSLTLGGMVGVISKAGGTQGIVQKLSKYANHSRGGQLATWFMGVLIFFDDYANTLIVGNTMRPFTDRLKISREKLSYIVDSTAAPVASIALVSTWIGFQIGLIDQAFNSLDLPHNAYNLFLQSIPYAFYSILALIFVFLIGSTLRDFGPMYRAEVRANTSGLVLRENAQPLTDSASLDMIADEKTPLRWYNALAPILMVIIVTLVGLYFDGSKALGADAASAKLGEIFGAANSFAVLMWASFTGLLLACVMALAQKILSLNETITAMVNGYKSMLLAAMILILAWAIGDICGDLHTANYVVYLSKGILSPHLIPFVTFAVAAFISFSTGTSWATMAILTPIVIPIAHQLPLEMGVSQALSHEIMIGTIGAVLSGSVLGDHCSPISDTTILSSMASAADHVDHVRTQLPYAVIVGIVASLVGYLPVGWGLNVFLSLIIGTILLMAVVFIFGKKIKD